MKRRIAFGTAGLLIAIVGVTLYVRTTWRNRDNPSLVRIGHATWVGYGPLYIAKERGFFSKRGLDVKLERMEGTGEKRSAMIARRVEALGSTLDELVVSAAQGVEGKMVLAFDQSAGADGILTAETIKDVSELKGKTIAVQPGFVNHFFLLYVLEQHGIAPEEIIIKPMEPDAAAAAFVAKDVDVAVTWEPHLSTVRQNRPDARVLLTSKEYPGLIVDALIFREDVIAERPNVVRGVVGAWYEALDYLKAHPAEGQDIIARALGVKPDEVAAMLSGATLLDEAQNRKVFDATEKLSIQAVARIVSRLWKKAGFIPQEIDATKLIDGSFLNGDR